MMSNNIFYEALYLKFLFSILRITFFYFLNNELNVRVATAQGKQGIWFLLFPDRENTGNFVLTQGKYLDCDY